MRPADRLLAHVETWRPYTAGYVGLVGLAGAGCAGVDEPWRLVVAWAVPTLAWVAGLYGGDYFDRELDAIEKPDRPIPSGRLGARSALALMWATAGIGAAIAAWANPWTALVAATAMAIGLAYSIVLKKHGLLGNLARGAMMALVVVFGSMTGGDFPTLAVLAPAFAVAAHDVSSNLVGTIRDVRGDLEGGYRTVAVARGVPSALRLAVAFYLVAGAATTWALTDRGAGVGPALVFGCALLAGGGALGVLLSSTERPDALRAHTFLLYSRLLVAGALVALGFGTPAAVVAVVAAGSFTLVSERALRARHEGVGPDDRAQITAADVAAYVEEQVRRVTALPSPPRTLTSWRRRIRIELDEPALALGLEVGGGRIRMLQEPPTESDALVIATTGRTFADIFWSRRSNPRRAFLQRRLSFAGSAADMVHANALFAEFLRSVVAGAAPSGPERIAAVVEPSQPATEPPPLPGLPARVVIADTTLRDGEQTPGVAFDLATKLEIARALDAAHVALIEVGFPAVSRAEAEAVREIAAAGLTAQTQAIARPVPADVEAALETGVDSIAVFVGTSDLHLRAKLRTTPDRLERAVAEAIALAAAGGASVVFAAEDATRSDPALLTRFFDVAVQSGATAIGIADTAGVAHPAGFARLVAHVAEQIPVPIGVHCHDDLGLAVANSLAGLAAGASGAQGSVLGIGERAGNACLEELVMALEIAHHVDTDVDLLALAPLADLVSRAARLPIPVNKPVVGRHMFTHESGLHVDGIVREPACYEPYPPELIGARRRIVLGKHSGRSCVTAVLEMAGRGAGEVEVAALLSQVKARGEAGHAVSAAELVAMLDAGSPHAAEASARQLLRVDGGVS